MFAMLLYLLGPVAFCWLAGFAVRVADESAALNERERTPRVSLATLADRTNGSRADRQSSSQF